MPDARSSEPCARIEVVGKRTRQDENTVAGCESLAASALARASTMDTRNGQLRLEHSAASWRERAALLQRLETSFNQRQALDRAEWEQADADELLHQFDRDADHVRL